MIKKLANQDEVDGVEFSKPGPYILAGLSRVHEALAHPCRLGPEKESRSMACGPSQCLQLQASRLYMV